jgi:hypothetical protein
MKMSCVLNDLKLTGNIRDAREYMERSYSAEELEGAMILQIFSDDRMVVLMKDERLAMLRSSELEGGRQ